MSSPAARSISSDAELRRAVLDTTRSWMLQAPAGSGKTELLIQRILACLATVEQPESVLAITFTRKAAAEMRNRVLTVLGEAKCFSDEEISKCLPHKQQSLRLARAALKTSDFHGWELLRHPARLQVRTLDSFCEAVAQRAPFKGLLGGAVQVTDDAQPLYELAAQRVIDQLASPGALGDAIAKLLENVQNDVRGVRNLLAAMLAQRDQWLHFLGRSDSLDAAQQQCLRERLEDALVLSVEEDLSHIRAHVVAALDGAQATELFALMRYAAEQLGNSAAPVIESIAASAEALSIANAASRPLRDIVEWPATTSEHLPAWRAICEFLLTGDHRKSAVRKKLDRRNGFPADSVHEKKQKKRCVELLKGIAKLPGAAEFCETLNRVRRLPDPCYTGSQWEFMRAVLRVLPVAAAHLQLVFAEKSVIDFAEYAQRALQAIGEEGDPTELGLQLGYRIRHILVDEFQDTNGVQVELLGRLLATWEMGEQCSSFCVGDPMQSIYAFRQADIAMYQQARRDGIGGHQHRFACLTQNFRSQAKLVEWFNRVFPVILDEESDLTNAVKYPEIPVESSREALEGPAVAIKGFAKGDRACEAKHMAECIRRELATPTAANETPSTIAVLVRSRTHLPELVEALRTADIPYRAVKTDRLADRPLVRDLEALRMALTNLADRTAWLAILRAPWCGLALADLLELCRGDEHSTVWELLGERLNDGYGVEDGSPFADSNGVRLSAHARMVLARCLPVLENSLKRSGRESLRALVESAWLRLGGPACLADRAQGARDAEAYFSLLEAQSEAGAIRAPENFAAKLQELFAPADHRAGIRVEIMPIHQAKGLEWDVVFLPALERRSRQDDKSLLYWRSRRSNGRESLLLGPIEAPGKRNRKAVTIEGYLRSIASDCSREELKRLFYVAATRARKRLYLSAAIGEERKPDDNSILHLLWNVPGIQQEFAPLVQPESGTATSEETAPELLLRRLPADYVAPSISASLQWGSLEAIASGEQHSFEWVGDLLPRVGIVAHRFLERIAREGVARWDGARVAAACSAISASLLLTGVAQCELEQGTERVLEALRRTLQDEHGRWLLSPHPEHRCELAVSAVVDGNLQHVRIDRTFVEHGTRWLIDYKITEQLGGDLHRFLQMQVEKYRPDMQRYVRVLHALDPRPVHCALYFPLLGRLCPV